MVLKAVGIDSKQYSWKELRDIVEMEIIGLVIGGYLLLFLGYLALAVIPCILVGIYASNRGRSGIGWFFLSLLISPLLTILILLVIGSPSGTLIDSKGRATASKKCPKCAEEVKKEAVICRFCGFEFPEEVEEKVIRDERTCFNCGGALYYGKELETGLCASCSKKVQRSINS